VRTTRQHTRCFWRMTSPAAHKKRAFAVGTYQSIVWGDPHHQVALALLAARDVLEQLVRLLQVAPDGLHLLHAVLVVLPPPPRLRPVDLLPRPVKEGSLRA